jgi:hypothetical protein
MDTESLERRAKDHVLALVAAQEKSDKKDAKEAAMRAASEATALQDQRPRSHLFRNTLVSAGARKRSGGHKAHALSRGMGESLCCQFRSQIGPRKQ